MSDWTSLQQRLRGRWQIPLLVVSGGLLAVSVFRLRPQPAKLPLSQAATYLHTLVSQGLFDRAADLAYAVLNREGERDADRAPIYLALARAEWGQVARSGKSTSEAGRRIEEHYRFAASHGEELDASDLLHLATVLEWQKKYTKALETYQAALQHGVGDPVELRKRMYLLMRDRLAASPLSLRKAIDTLLPLVGEDRLAMRLWAIEEKTYLLDRLGKLDEAATLWAENRPRFSDTRLRDRFDYLHGWILYRQGRFDEAERFLRALRNHVDRTAEVDAMTGWLLGRVVLSDGGPQRPLEALSFFQDVLTYHASSPYALASRLGAAEALGWMDRHDDAVTMYRIALEDWKSLKKASRLVDRDVFLASLQVMVETQKEEGNREAALEYARLAATLIDRNKVEQTTILLEQLAQMERLRAEELDARSGSENPERGPVEQAHSASARSHFAAAAAAYVDLSQLSGLNEERSASASWKAATLYARAGQFRRAVELYRAFTVERPGHSLVPRALLRIGRILQTTGRIPEAIEAYQACYRRFPHTLDGSRTLVPLAECYLALGAQNDKSEELAEKTLQIVLQDSEVFTPQAPEFADALFLLGELVNRRGQNERAIATLEEAIQRYPEDPRVTRARYLLADSYRRSALALKQDLEGITAVEELEQVRKESLARFARARALYRQLITDYEVRGVSGLDALEALYLRHAHLYEADCYFESQEYRPALKRYEEAAGMFKDDPIALSAYVQIVNCHIFLGEKNEARAALARALVLTSAIPESAFARRVSGETREDWKRYFEWLGKSELFS